MSFVFFTDRDLGKQFPEILRAAGFAVERHIDHFADMTPDPEWLEAVSKRGWIAVTHDANIRYKPNELDAVRRHSVALLVVVGKATNSELAQSFVSTRPRIEAFLQRAKRPFIAKVYRPSPSDLARGTRIGRVEMWWPAKGE